MAEDRLDDAIEALEALHEADGADLHFRFMGRVKGRHFILDVEFEKADPRTGERLQPVEYDFMIGKLLGLVLKHVSQGPNPALH